MFGKFVLRTFVGLVVYLIIGSLVAGQSALTALFMLVVCTAGAGLIVAIPAAYLIGLVCTIGFIPLEDDTQSGVSNSRALPNPDTTSLSRAALERFVDDCLEHGRKRDSIRAECLRAGWSEDLINDAFEGYEKRCND